MTTRSGWDRLPCLQVIFDRTRLRARSAGRWLVPLGALALLLLGAPPAFAIDQNVDTDVVGTLDESNLTTLFAQTFTAGETGTLTWVRPELRCAGYCGQKLQVEIRDVQDGAPGQKVLGRETVDLSLFVNTPLGLATVPLSTPVTL